ncbi:hypothetical protein [Jiella pacifica]|uniref:Invasion protein IalB, involved in pathogenesis n=1 Tax=Jiella pacifica TaxID=2696469 RepID=A0A6N9SYW6_9HYPH|nr:hypothetical protein [Jiella pacifica]NDW03542.1 hypothetical protein [Jiella pacifica]
MGSLRVLGTAAGDVGITKAKQEMKTFQRAARAIVLVGAMIVGGSPAHVQAEPFGQPISGWSLTQEAVKGEWRVRCRATRNRSGSTYRIDVYANWKWYVSVSPIPRGLNGKYPKAHMNLTDGPIDTPAYTSGNLLVFGPIEDFSLDAIAQQGGGVAVVGPTTVEVDLGDNTSTVTNSLVQCIQANS